jgi:hypothetical protein
VAVPLVPPKQLTLVCVVVIVNGHCAKPANCRPVNASSMQSMNAVFNSLIVGSIFSEKAGPDNASLTPPGQRRITPSSLKIYPFNLPYLFKISLRKPVAYNKSYIYRVCSTVSSDIFTIALTEAPGHLLSLLIK